MGHARHLLVLTLLLCVSAHGQQGLPVYVALQPPSGTCIGNRVWVTDTAPAALWCCIAGTWSSCTPTTATQLAGDGTNCAAGEAARGVDQAGNAQGCWTPQPGSSCSPGQHATAISSLGELTCSEVAWSQTAGVAEQLAQSGSCDPGQCMTGINTYGEPTACVTPLTSFSESDPQVGTLTANLWCAANAGGTAVDCTKPSPILSFTDPWDQAPIVYSTATGGPVVSNELVGAGCDATNCYAPTLEFTGGSVSAAGATGGNVSFYGGASSLGNAGRLLFQGGSSVGGVGGAVELNAGSSINGRAGSVAFLGGYSAAPGEPGGSALLAGGPADDGVGGEVQILGGDGMEGLGAILFGGGEYRFADWGTPPFIVESVTCAAGHYLRLDGDHQLECVALPAEDDPQVGTVTDTKWCKGNASGQVECSTSYVPLPSTSNWPACGDGTFLKSLGGYNYPTCVAETAETDPQVGTLTSDLWCASNAGGTALDCNKTSPVLTEVDPKISLTSPWDGAPIVYDTGTSKLIVDHALRGKDCTGDYCSAPALGLTGGTATGYANGGAVNLQGGTGGNQGGSVGITGGYSTAQEGGGGGHVYLSGGSAPAGSAGEVALNGGYSEAPAYPGGNVTIYGGGADYAAGGNVTIAAGSGTSDGSVYLSGSNVQASGTEIHLIGSTYLDNLACDSGEFLTSGGGDTPLGCGAALTSIAGGICAGEDDYVIGISEAGSVACGKKMIAEDLHGTVKGRGTSLGTTCAGGEVVYGFNSSVAPSHVDYGRMVCRPPLANAGCTAPEVLQGFDAAGAAICVEEDDPQVGTLTASRWCSSDGTQVHCGEFAPMPDPECGYEEFPIVGAAGWECTTTAPNAAGLASDGSNCSSGQAALGVDSQGNAQDCWTPATDEVGAVTNGQWCVGNGTQVTCASSAPAAPGSCGGDVVTATTTSGVTCRTVPAIQTCGAGTYISGFAANGLAYCSAPPALASNGGNCGAGQAARGVDGSGVAEDCFAVVTAESDPYVDTVASSGNNWCRGNASSHVQCDYAAPAVGSITGGDCPTDQFMYGMNTNGTPKCRPIYLPIACQGCGGGQAEW